MDEDRPDLLDPAGKPGVPLLDLKPGQCRFPLPHDGRSPARFCGEPTRHGGSWCPEHRRLVYAAPSHSGARSRADRG